MSDLANLTLTEAADAVRTGQATSIDLLNACLANLDATNGRVNAMTWLDREGAEASARAADQAVRDKKPLGRLHGVPMAHKDMYYQAGKLSTCGSALRKDWRPDYTATVIERMALTRFMPASDDSALDGRWEPTITTGIGTFTVRFRK